MTTMTGEDVWQLLENLAAIKSPTQKQVMIGGYQHDELFKRVLWWALNPYITFGVAKLPTKVESRPDAVELATDQYVWDVLKQLSERALTGFAARDEITNLYGALTPKSQSVLHRILAKDLRCGVTAKTVNKVMKGFIPVFDCMLAHPFEEKRVKTWPQAVESKLDGFRALGFAAPGHEEVILYTRSGREYTTFEAVKPVIAAAFHPSRLNGIIAANPSLVSDFEAIFGNPVDQLGFVLDGEAVSGSFNKTSGDLRRKEEQAEDAEFHAFDLVQMGVFTDAKVPGVPYSARRRVLEAIVNGFDDPRLKVVPRYTVNSVAEIRAIYNKVRARGGEGVIVKNLGHFYVKKRDYGWQKVKAEETVDAPVIGAFEGTGKYVGMLGGLIVKVGDVEVSVGGGFTDQQRKDFWEAWQHYLRADPMDECIFGRMIEVEYHEKTPDGSLRHPRFVRFRDDKSAPDTDDEKEAA